MATLDYQAAIKAGKSPQEIKAFVDAHSASGKPLQVVNTAPLQQPTGLDKAGGIANKFLGGLASFTGLDKAGESLGRLGLQLGHQMGKVAGVDTNTTLPAPKFAGKQFSGDALTLAGTGLNLAAPGSGSLGRTVAASAGAGGLLGAGNDLTQGKGVGQAVEHGLEKGAIAGAVTGGIGLLGKGVSALTNKLPQAMYKASVGVPNNTDASILLDEGLYGSRSTMKPAVADALRTVEADIQRSPSMGNAVDLADLNGYQPLKKLGEDTKLAGEGATYKRVLEKLFPPQANPALEDKLFNAEVTANLNDPAQAQKLAEVAKEALQGPGTKTVGEALKMRRAIDQFTPRSAFMDTATGIEANTKNTVADGMRGLIDKAAPDIRPGLDKEQAMIQLQNALKAYDQAKASGIPGTTGNFLQRTVMTPAVATPIAQFGHNTGKVLDKAGQNLIVQALKRMGRIGAISALGKQ